MRPFLETFLRAPDPVYSRESIPHSSDEVKALECNATGRCAGGDKGGALLAPESGDKLMEA
jgi:hypothetical protein